MFATVTNHPNFIQHYFLGTSRLSEIFNIPLIVIGGSLLVYFIFIPIARVVLDVLDFRRLRDRKLVFLELTPPSYATKSPLATTQLLDTIHGLLNGLTHTEHLLNRKHVLPLEIFGSRETGIRFIAVLDPGDVGPFQQLVISYLPHIQFREVKDYITPELNGQDSRILEFVQSNHFAYRMAKHENLAEHDPMDYITRAMAKLESGELSAIQLVLSPASRRAANKIRSQLLHGKDKGLNREWWHYPFIILWWVVKAVFAVLRAILELIGDEVSGVRAPRYNSDQSHMYNQYGQQPVSPINAPVMDTTNAKLAEQLFSVDIRALTVGPDCATRAQGLANALYMFPEYQVTKGYT
ncbi:MAG TPA: hypothetical protein VIH90_01540 [Candidatus Saccharimonadales bacterium]